MKYIQLQIEYEGYDQSINDDIDKLLSLKGQALLGLTTILVYEFQDIEEFTKCFEMINKSEFEVFCLITKVESEESIYEMR